MTTNDIKALWADTYQRLSEEAEAFRDSQAVSFGLLQAYDSLPDEGKRVVHSILAEWIVSDDNRQRYDAGFLTSQRCIRSMKASIEKAVAKAQQRSGPEAEYEVKKLQRILAELEMPG